MGIAVTPEDKQLTLLLRHVRHVQEGCEIIGRKLIERGESDLGWELIANGLCHDRSKFFGAERAYLHGEAKENDPENFKKAAFHHVMWNAHHPECSGSVHEMSLVDVAEMVADWWGRSIEFGDDVREWAEVTAAKRYGYGPGDAVWAMIQEYLGMLLEPRFK
jgi:hypothetical protein